MKALIIGTGRMGQNHVKAAQSLGLEIIALVDRDSAKLETAATALGLSKDILFTDLNAALAMQPDVVMIATTAPAHAELTMACAKAGIKNILCEKPMAQSLRQCDDMIKACDAAGSKLAINHQMRFMDQYTNAKKLVSSDEFGGISSMTVVAGCFGLAMNGTHYIEAFRYLTDDKPARVQAWFAPDDLANPRGPDFKDKAGSIRIETSSGKRLYIEASNDHGHGMTFTIATPYGHIIADELAGEMITTNRNAEHRGLPATRYGMPNQRNKMEIPVADNVKPTAAVLKALLDGENYPTGQQARQALAALVAAYVSNDNGNRAIYVDGELPEDTIFPWA